MIDEGKRQALIYTRISDVKQSIRGDGIRSQETRCLEYARHRGYDVIQVFEDHITGKSAERPGMKSMLNFLRKNRAKKLIVIIDDISRMARQVTSHWELRARVAEAGGVLESPSIKFGDSSDDHFLENILASAAQHHREKNAEQTKNRMKARVQNGFWVFQAPTGLKYQRLSGRGKVLVRDEPVASVVQEALESYASGRFETQADVMRWLQNNPLFPKDKTGIIRHQRVHILLTQPVYAGYIEAPDWGVGLRVGQHEPLISYQTYQRIQDRLADIGRTPMRKNLNEAFPLRGFVLCDDCGGPLTANWSKGSHDWHAYYLCRQRGCVSHGKSIRRDVIEGEFKELIQSVRPIESVAEGASVMFKNLWDRRLAQADSQRKALGAQLIKIERQVATFLERILEVSVPSVIAAYEERIRKFEMDKHVLKEQIAKAGRPMSSFEDTFRTALEFLANPWNLWNSGRLEDRRTVLKLVFASRLRYARNEGFRTQDLTLPFKLLGALGAGVEVMARPKGFEPLTPRFVV